MWNLNRFLVGIFVLTISVMSSSLLGARISAMEFSNKQKQIENLLALEAPTPEQDKEIQVIIAALKVDERYPDLVRNYEARRKLRLKIQEERVQARAQAQQAEVQQAQQLRVREQDLIQVRAEAQQAQLQQAQQQQELERLQQIQGQQDRALQDRAREIEGLRRQVAQQGIDVQGAQNLRQRVQTRERELNEAQRNITLLTARVNELTGQIEIIPGLRQQAQNVAQLRQELEQARQAREQAQQGLQRAREQILANQREIERLKSDYKTMFEALMQEQATVFRDFKTLLPNPQRASRRNEN